MNFERLLVLFESECIRYEVVIVLAVAVVTRYHNAHIANRHFGLGTLADSVDSNPSQLFEATTDLKSDRNLVVAIGATVLTVESVDVSIMLWGER